MFETRFLNLSYLGSARPRRAQVFELMPYAHPKLASVEARAGGKSHEDRLEELHRLSAEDD